MTIAEWNRAASTDETLKLSSDILRKLTALQLRPQHYSRRKLFISMIRQQPILFNDFPLRFTLQPFFDHSDLPALLKKLFKTSPKTLARIGPNKRVQYLPVHEVVDKWHQEKTIFSANDIFFRNIGLDDVFDCRPISDFNIIPEEPDISYIEVATVLMGTTGCWTDSHSDDPDGSNYCIRGKKLWFVWDRTEGRKHGLEDCEYDDVYTQAKFDLSSFIKLPSARWFTVCQGQTLFLPGNLTHKVITLEKYLGISSFYLGLPNALSTLSRWKFDGTAMVTPRLQNKLMKILLRQLEKVAKSDRKCKHQWGYYYLKDALQSWQQKYSKDERQELCTDLRFKELVSKIILYSRQ